jgi:hypothetical protein
MALAAAEEPMSLNYIPDPEFRAHVLAAAGDGTHTIKANMTRRVGDTVTVWLWTAQPSMQYLSERRIMWRARSEVSDCEHVHQIRANSYRSAAPVGGEVLEYIYRVSAE